MNQFHFDVQTKSGIGGGILTILFINLRTEDVLKTIVLAAVGAAVSFLTSFFLQRLMKRWRKR